MAVEDNQAENQAAAPAQPGQVVAPHSTQPAPAGLPDPASQAPQAPAPPAPARQAEAPEPVPPRVPTGLPDPSDDPYSAQDDKRDTPLPEDAISWTASEFIAHEKSTGWYTNLAIAVIIIAALIYLLTRDLITTGIILFCAFIFGIYARRQPRQLPYQVDASGIQIGRRHYDYEAFKSFSVVPEGAFASIVLVPMKRFAPLSTMYYDPKDEEKIVNMLLARLPYEERKSDPVDSFMQRIRF